MESSIIKIRSDIIDDLRDLSISIPESLVAKTEYKDIWVPLDEDYGKVEDISTGDENDLRKLCDVLSVNFSKERFIAALNLRNAIIKDKPKISANKSSNSKIAISLVLIAIVASALYIFYAENKTVNTDSVSYIEAKSEVEDAKDESLDSKDKSNDTCAESEAINVEPEISPSIEEAKEDALEVEEEAIQPNLEIKESETTNEE